MKITVVDGYTENPGDLSWQPLRELGELTVYEHYTPDEEEVIRRIGDSEIVIDNDVKITRRVMEACPNIRFITMFATGYDAVDCAYARERGIPVSNIPAYGTATVAQYAISLLLEICGHAAYHSEQVHAGRWSVCDDWFYRENPVIELDGKTIGIIGFGRIGQRVGQIAAAMGMRVLAYNRSRNESGEKIGSYVNLDTLLRESDVISLHCPLFPETERIIDREAIAKMKDGVIIVNNSRGRLIDEAALAEALGSGKVYAAAVDVVSSEPIKEDNPLLHAPNCIITPHLSWTAKEARQRIMLSTAENIKAFLRGEPQNVVNGK